MLHNMVYNPNGCLLGHHGSREKNCFLISSEFLILNRLGNIATHKYMLSLPSILNLLIEKKLDLECQWPCPYFF